MPTVIAVLPFNAVHIKDVLTVSVLLPPPLQPPQKSFPRQLHPPAITWQKLRRKCQRIEYAVIPEECEPQLQLIHAGALQCRHEPSAQFVGRVPQTLQHEGFAIRRIRLYKRPRPLADDDKSRITYTPSPPSSSSGLSWMLPMTSSPGYSFKTISMAGLPR